MPARRRLHYSVPMTENSAESSTPQVKRSGSKRPASADQERLIRRYLSALETTKPGRGVKRASDAVGNRITKVDELLVSADPLRRVHLTQERIELHAEYVRLTNGNHAELSQLERDFVRVVRSYGDRHGITYAAWRQVGVEATVLEKAGIHKAEKKPPPAVLRAEQEAAGGRGGGKAERPDGESAGAQNGTAATRPEAATLAAAPLQEPSSGEVSLDELADLLAEAGPGPADPARQKADQPNLGEGFETSVSGAGDAASDQPRPRPRPRATGS